MTGKRPGWYADPDNRHQARWWDGAAWTQAKRELPSQTGNRDVPETPSHLFLPPPTGKPLLLDERIPGSRESTARRALALRGRASRREYLRAVLMLLISTLVAVGAISALEVSAISEGAFNALSTAILVPVIGLLISTAAATVRRLHDVGMSGWHALWLLAPFGVFLLVLMAVQRGDDLTNRFGPPPESLKKPMHWNAANAPRD